MDNNKNMITDWLDQYGDNEISQFIDKNLEITENVNRILKEKGWAKAAFALKIGKKPSEVTRWLSGMHNLTLKSIIKMEVALGVNLIHTTPIKETEYVFMGVIENQQEIIEKNIEYQNTFSIAV